MNTSPRGRLPCSARATAEPNGTCGAGHVKKTTAGGSAMGVSKTNAATDDTGARPSDWRERKKQVLTKSTASMGQSIAHAIVLKDEGLFIAAERDGFIPFQGAHGFG